MTWHRLDPTDAYFSYETQHLYVGLEAPREPGLRRAVGRLAAANPQIFRYTDQAQARWRPFTAAELREAPERLVVRLDIEDPEVAFALIADWPLAGPNFRVHSGPGWLALRVAHGAHFDGITIGLLLEALLSPTGPQPLTVVPGWQRNLLLGRYLARHPRAVRAAVAYRRHLGDEGFAAPLGVPDEPAVLTHARSEAVDVSALRELRDRSWPGASLGSVVLCGLRAAMTHVGLEPRAGAEVLFDVRGQLGAPWPWFGNWAAGVQVEADDDLDPPSVTEAVRATASSGLPVAAMAAGRVLGTVSPRSSLDRPVPKPVGVPRLSYTYLAGHSPVGRLPWRDDGPVWLLERTRPANAEAMTAVVKEIGSTLALNVSHYDSVWPAELVAKALELLLTDPVGVVETARAARDGAEGGAR